MEEGGLGNGLFHVPFIGHSFFFLPPYTPGGRTEASPALMQQEARRDGE